jgi:hypothetical protein
MYLKTFLTVALALVLTIGMVSAVTMSVDELLQLQKADTELGGFFSPDIIGTGDKMVTIAKLDQYATTTLSVLDSGTTYLLSATGTLINLPKVNKGTTFTFVVNGALGVANVVVDSAEGDNIEGTLIVAGAVVDCAGEDQINIVVDGENIGDYFTLTSDGTQWLIGDSGALTASKLTCTDPS